MGAWVGVARDGEGTLGGGGGRVRGGRAFGAVGGRGEVQWGWVGAWAHESMKEQEGGGGEGVGTGGLVAGREHGVDREGEGGACQVC